jgi:type IV pilus assembly protein PilE
MSKKVRGFTLLELMIVVAIMAILAIVAYSGYNNQVRKSRRAEAKQLLSDFTLRQEKWRSNHASYATCDELLAPTTCTNYNGATNPVSKWYTIAVTANSATGYTMTATPRSGSDQTKDKCGTLQVQMTSGVLFKTPTTTGCWQ